MTEAAFPIDVEIRDNEPEESVTPTEAEENLRATDAERAMTDALSALKRRGERVVTTVEHVVTPRRLMIGAAVVIGLGALLLMGRGRRRAPRRPRTIAGAVARSLAREVVGRVVLGAAAAAGARIAEAAVPMIVAAISSHQLAATATRPPRAKKRKTPAPREMPPTGNEL